VFEYGDSGDHFYLILEGLVEIQIPENNKEEF
jgi:CRP-like cAMP-binding protein